MRQDFSVESDEGDTKQVDYSKLDTDYIPEEFPHRQEIIEDLYNSVFRPLLQRRKADNFMLLGRSGTGKTAITKASLEWVEEDNPIGVVNNFDTAFINCSRKSSYKRVLQGLADELDIEWKEGVANDVNSDRIFKEINNREKPVLVVLDELDFLKKRNGRSYINKVLYSLTRPQEMCPDDEWNSAITVLAISNDTKVMSYISEDNMSKADPEVKECKRYQKEEIVDIIQQRHDIAFQNNFLNEEAIERIADEVKETYDSDIRKGIKILQKTSEIEGVEDPMNVVEEAISKYRDRYIERVLQSSDIHELIIVKALCTNLMKDKKTLEKINEGYRKGCEKLGLDKGDKNKSRTFVYRKLDELEDQDLVNKRKDYNQAQNPFVFESKVDLERLYTKAQQKIERNGFEQKEGKTEKEIEAEQEAEEVMEDIGVA
jgi:Cdc6-like AAA superfamily ATPase